MNSLLTTEGIWYDHEPGGIDDTPPPSCSPSPTQSVLDEKESWQFTLEEWKAEDEAIKEEEQLAMEDFNAEAIKSKAEEDEMNEMSLDDLRVTEAACEDEQAYWDEELRELCDWMMNGDDED